MPHALPLTADRRVVLSATWIFVALNYLYADIIMMIFRPNAYGAMASRMPAWMAVVATALMELLLGMVLLSRVLTYRVNRRVNVVAGVIGTLFVAVTISPQAPLVYVLLCAVEMSTTVFIVWYAWTWREPASVPVSA